MTSHDPIPARLAALTTTPTPDLKQQWRGLFDGEPPPFNRRYLESRLAYRIQELVYGGLNSETVRRLERLGEDLDGGDRKKSGTRADRGRPLTGTRLLREWQGVEKIVTVTADGFEWQGRPYKSLSAIARDHRHALVCFKGMPRAPLCTRIGPLSAHVANSLQPQWCPHRASVLRGAARAMPHRRQVAPLL